MNITVLSPYQLFFIDEENKMWTVLKDGRVRFIKMFESFQNVASDRTHVCGVTFTGDKTNALLTDFTFDPVPEKPLFSGNGFFYYPNLLMNKRQKLAIIKADLLNEQGTGDLIIYERARTVFHPKVKFPARIAPSLWDPKTGDLYYITAKNALASTDGRHGQIIADHATLFTMNPACTEIAYYNQDCITLVSLETGVHQRCIAFDVRALAYDATGENLFFSTFKEKSSIYKFDKRTEEVSLLLNHPHPVQMMTNG